jgi:hypothetical protein
MHCAAVLRVGMADQCGFGWLTVLRLFEESLEFAGGSIDKQGFDSAGQDQLER